MRAIRITPPMHIPSKAAVDIPNPPELEPSKYPSPSTLTVVPSGSSS